MMITNCLYDTADHKGLEQEAAAAYFINFFR